MIVLLKRKVILIEKLKEYKENKINEEINKYKNSLHNQNINSNQKSCIENILGENFQEAINAKINPMIH